MKNIFNNNKILIIVFTVLLGWGLFAANDYRNQWNQSVKGHQQLIEQCQTEYANNQEAKEFCDRLIENYPPKNYDTLSIFFDIIGNYSLRFLQIIAPLFVVTPAIWNFHKQLKTGFVKNVMTRMQYNKYIKKSLIKAWKNALIIPVFLIIMFFIAYLFSGNFDIQRTITKSPGYLFINAKYIKILPQFIFTFILNLILHSIFWINLGFILTKKSRNIIVTLVSYFILYILIFMVSEVGIGAFIFVGLLKIKTGMHYFNLANIIWAYDFIDNLLYTTLYPLLLAIITYLIVIKIYKNKEEVIIENEK